MQSREKAIRTDTSDTGEMISIRMMLANGLSIYSACIILLMIFICPASSHEVLLTMHENYTQKNCTLQVEDIDSQAAKVWVLIRCETSLSMVLGINDTLSCGRLKLNVKGFYAGESSDLVCLMINSTD